MPLVLLESYNVKRILVVHKFEQAAKPLNSSSDNSKSFGQPSGKLSHFQMQQATQECFFISEEQFASWSDETTVI